jgi:UDP-N-acetylmuramoyl-L-alanyl-D-glutamate--2,6-diaminopimelate ligase
VPAVPATPDGAAGAPLDKGAAASLRPSSPLSRPLPELLDHVPVLTTARPLDGVVVTGCTHDSRAVRPGDLYVALPGSRVHGADFSAAAAASGAAAVLTDAAGAERAGAGGLPVLVAPDPRAVLGQVARWVHDDPAAAMRVFGITGTNGKTTTAFLLEAGLRAAGHRTGLLGTVLTRIGDEVLPSVRTTPEAPDLQALLAMMRERGTDAVVMEVSSHALALGRVDGLVFDTAVFTNLSQDHLDFHGSMQEYEAVKASLFTAERSRQAVVCVDDSAGRRIAAGASVPCTTVATGDAEAVDPDWLAVAADLRTDGSSFRLTGRGADGSPREVAASVRLPGAFNVANAALALVALWNTGVDPAAAVRGVASLPGVPGRMERVEAGQPYLALVDYAHTPEAVTTLLETVRTVVEGRIVVVLGCGGDRDAAKRPLMARAAVEGADVAVLTSDNPRSEDPLEILRQMSQAVPGRAAVEPDRRAAIRAAVAGLGPGDAVVVAGKGHETGQEAGGVVTPFDDRIVLREAIEQVRA